MPEFGYDYDYVVRVVAAESRGDLYEGQLAGLSALLKLRA